jgi:pimeloyl-ACP methyl ester carboxylesterase
MRVRSTDEVTVELHDLGGNGPPLLIAHATGFCAGAYRPMATSLTGAHHVWALDFRAHGNTSTPDDLKLTWNGMTDDILAVSEALGGDPLRAFGHSMGGACLMAAELARPQTLAAAVLFEPMIVPKGSGRGGSDNALAAGARRRRSRFASREEALTRYASRPPLGTFRADALHDYVHHGFADQPDGTVELRCSPEREAQVFEAPGKPEIASLPSVDVPVLVTRGGRDGPAGPAGLAGLAAEQLSRGTLLEYPHLSHFGPFQDPDGLARDVLEFFEQN